MASSYTFALLSFFFVLTRTNVSSNFNYANNFLLFYTFNFLYVFMACPCGSGFRLYLFSVGMCLQSRTPTEKRMPALPLTHLDKYFDESSLSKEVFSKQMWRDVKQSLTHLDKYFDESSLSKEVFSKTNSKRCKTISHAAT